MPNSNDRGSTRDRLARKLFLLTKFGNGIECACHECGTTVDITTIVVDRVVPKIFGGTYCRNNIAPHCHQCSNRQGKRLSMTLFQNDTHKAIWIGHHCERCFHGMDCPILEHALTTGRKPKQWDRNTSRNALMQDSIKCNSETARPPKVERAKAFEDVPMFDVEPQDVNYVPVDGLPTERLPSRRETDHA